MEPFAYLILSNLPGQNRLKNIKYLLGLGDNVLGTDPRCQIVIPPRYQMPNHALNIRISHNFITIEALHPHLVYVESNLKRNRGQEANVDNFFPLAQNLHYIARVNQFFYVGRVKVVIGSSSVEELIRMKNIQNRQLFRTEYSITQPKVLLFQKVIKPQEKVQSKQEVCQMVQIDLKDTILPKDPNNAAKSGMPANAAKSGMPANGAKSGMSAEQVQPTKKEQKQQQVAAVSEKSRTERLDQQDYQYQATLVLQDGMYTNQPTLNLDQPNFQTKNNNQNDCIIQRNEVNSHPRSTPYSQEALINEIRMQERSQHQQNNNQEIDFSMPDTIVDREPQDHPKSQPRQSANIFKQVESKQEEPQQMEDEDAMPPTIQEDTPAPQKLRPAKTLVVDRSVQPYPNRLYMSDQVSNKKEINESLQYKNIENFDDLFGIDQKQPQIKHFSSLPAEIKEQQPPNLSLMHISSMKDGKIQSGSKQEGNKKKKDNLVSTELYGKKKKEVQEDMVQQKQVNIQNKVNIAGFKPTAAHRDFLKKQGLEIVSNPHNDYGILLIRQPLRVCNKLLLALIEGKRIENQQWIFNKQSEIQSKINGLSWKQIQQVKGTHKNILKGKGKFYISKRLQDLFEGVVQQLGGELITQLTDKKKVINIVLRPEDSLDTELYLNYRQNKKWRFLRNEAITDCVLTGKFSVEQKYIINIFKDDQ